MLLLEGRRKPIGQVPYVSRRVQRLVMLAERIGRGDVAGAFNDLKRWSYSTTVAFGLRYDFSQTPAGQPDCELSFRVVPLTAELAARVFDTSGLGDSDRALLDRRRAIWDAGFEGGHVALADNGDPIYLQWVIPPRQAEKVRQYWGDLFDDLDDNTALVEGVWVPPRYRGRGIMAAASVAINQVSEPFRYAVAFVADDNHAALRGFTSAGYQVHTVRTERWLGGRRTVQFKPADSARILG